MNSHIKILLVEDSTTNSLLIDYILKEKGYQVILSTDGLQALKLASEEKPGLILLDIMLPKMDGFQILANLKKDDYTKNIPVFIVTSKSDSESEKKAYELGAVDYIRKPIDIKSFTNKVGNVFKSALKQ